jgi:hypothetical protein
LISRARTLSISLNTVLLFAVVAKHSGLTEDEDFFIAEDRRGEFLEPPGVVLLIGDFEGEGKFAGKPNLLASPLRTMVQFNDSMLAVPAQAASEIKVERRSAQEGGGVVVSLSFKAARRIVGTGTWAELQSDWTLELAPSARELVFNATGRASEACKVTVGLFYL